MLPIKEENKFFSRHLTKESSISNPSFRVYYGGNSVAVPFVWEAKPGTPKHTKHNFSHEQQNKQYFPPLTPPPSYYLKQPQNLPYKKSFGKNFLGNLLPKSMHRRQTSSASTLSCPSSSMLLDSTIRGTERSSSLKSSLGLSLSRGRRRTKFNSGSLFDFMVNSQEDDDEEIDIRSPRSVLCFGFAGSRRIRSCSMAHH